MHAHHINLRKIGIMFLIFTLVFTGISVSLGAPVSYAASSAVYVSSSKGDDINGDGSEATPYATLKTAYTEVSDGERYISWTTSHKLLKTQRHLSLI